MVRWSQGEMLARGTRRDKRAHLFAGRGHRVAGSQLSGGHQHWE